MISFNNAYLYHHLGMLTKLLDSIMSNLMSHPDNP